MTACTDSEGGGKKLSRVGKPRRVPFVSFWRKIYRCKGNQRVCPRAKIWIYFSCARMTNTILPNKFPRLCFLLDHAFGHAAGAKLSSLPPFSPRPTLAQNSYRKTCTASRIVFCDRLLAGNESLFFISVNLSFKIIVFPSVLWPQHEITNRVSQG